MSYKDIGAALGVTKNAAIGKADRMGLIGKKKPKTVVVEFPERGRCVYPHGHPGKPGFRFCGAPVEREGGPYCEAHHKLCFVKEKAAA